MRLANALSGRVERLVPRVPPLVQWYLCGPTVYNHAHLGHARTMVSFDLLRRFLHKRGHYVDLAISITDVDDKVIRAARERSTPALELAAEFESSFFEDMDALGVLRPNAALRVSDHIEDIIDFARRIESQGFAYPDGSGNLWFDTRAFDQSGHHKYGKLRPAAFKERERGIESEHGKKSSSDFALWKAAKDGEIFWESPWGKGRPGWHIECSAMS